MTTFKDSLKHLISNSIYNHYGEENYDVARFGTYNQKKTINSILKDIIKKTISHNKKKITHIKLGNIKKDIPKFERIWQNLSSEDKNLLIHVIAYRLMGYEKIKLPLNAPEYWKALKKAEKLVDGNETYDPKFLHFILQKFDLNPIGYNIKIFFSPIAIAIDFIIEQYAYKSNGSTVVGVEDGDYVMDIGGCWGDTALYFAQKAGINGKVYSFEFIPNNIKLHNINTALNPSLQSRIKLVPQPVADQSNIPIFYEDFGPASKIFFEPNPRQTGETHTVSIDDYVELYGIENVDFIKMDIEGAEKFALKGATKTIKRFKPKLAIAIYHSMDDLADIPNWILDLDLGYEIFLGHYTIHSEETVVFAKVKNR